MTAGTAAQGRRGPFWFHAGKRKETTMAARGIPVLIIAAAFIQALATALALPF
ncbi:MAG: hypothetical protein R3C16_11325 [Hyphomonadaceae bacterium]